MSEHAPVPRKPPTAVCCGAAGENRQPIPERLLIVEPSNVSDHADQRSLNRVACSVFVSARADDQVAKEAAEVRSMEFPERCLFTLDQPRGEDRDRRILERCCVG